MSAALVTAAQNPELVRATADVVKSTQSNAMKVLKVVGITIGAGLATFFVVRLVKKAKEKKEADKKIEAYTKLDEEKDGTKSYDDSVYTSMAESLYTAFDNRKNSVWCSYDDESIYRTLEKLRSIADWKLLVSAFATRPANNSDGGKEHDLVWYLGANKANHKADYQAILNKIGLPGILGRIR